MQEAEEKAAAAALAAKQLAAAILIQAAWRGFKVGRRFRLRTRGWASQVVTRAPARGRGSCDTPDHCRLVMRLAVRLLVESGLQCRSEQHRERGSAASVQRLQVCMAQGCRGAQQHPTYVRTMPNLGLFVNLSAAGASSSQGREEQGQQEGVCQEERQEVNSSPMEFDSVRQGGGLLTSCAGSIERCVGMRG